MEVATDHDSMIRAQAKAQLLRQLFGPTLEQNLLAAHQHQVTTAQPYMALDAYGEEPTQ